MRDGWLSESMLTNLLWLLWLLLVVLWWMLWALLHMMSCFSVSCSSNSSRSSTASLSLLLQLGTEAEAEWTLANTLFSSIRLKLCSRLKSPKGSWPLSPIMSRPVMLMSRSSKVSMVPRSKSNSLISGTVSKNEVPILVEIISLDKVYTV